MAEVHVKENESLDSALKRLSAVALRPAFFPRFERGTL